MSPSAAPKSPTTRPGGPQPLRRRRAPRPAAAGSGASRRILNYVLVFVTVILVVDALVGDKGLLQTIKARKEYAQVAASLETLKADNERLREEIRRLKEDPAAIEAIARQDLGLMRRGEVLFIVRDATPAQVRRERQSSARLQSAAAADR